MCPCPLLFVPSSVPFMRTAALVSDTLLSMIRLYTCPGDPVLSGPISSSLAELYFLSSSIISHCIPLACLLEPSGLHLAHSTWSPTLRHSFDPCSPQNPTDMSCSDCLCSAPDLAVALAKFSLVFIFSVEETLFRAASLSRQPSSRAFLCFSHPTYF